MRRLLLALALCIVTAAIIHSQNALTIHQRVADLDQLSSFYAKNYAPYEWKRDVFGFDLLNLKPWQPEISKATTDDLNFQELLIEYVASLNDAHDYIAFPTTFSASLPFTVDIFEGEVLIDSINRATLPINQYPFGIGDELVSVDGRSAQDLIQSFRKYAASGNSRSTDRTAASRIVSRNQQIMPHTCDLGDTATVVVRLANSEVENSYVVPWRKIGIPVTSQGPVPSPTPVSVKPSSRNSARWTSALKIGPPFFNPEELETFSDMTGSAFTGLFHQVAVSPTDYSLPPYMQPVLPLLNASVSQEYYSVLNMGSRTPVFMSGLFSLGFNVRKGFSSEDFIFSGTYVFNGLRVGLIRIPNMSPSNTTQAFQQIDEEIMYFNNNTDALVVDVMRNPGGLVSFVESLAQRFIPTPFRTIGFEIRATGAWLYTFAAQLTTARLTGAPPETIANLESNYDEVLKAFNENRGLSAPVSLNSTGTLILEPASVCYTKPLMVLTDEFSASGGDMFPAIIQDNDRGPIFGMRTMGAGGSVVGFNATAYTESYFRITVSLMSRANPIQINDFPAAPYIENMGVRPDRIVDYMTRDNLTTGGAPFVQAFTAAIVQLVQTGSVQ